MPAPPWTAAPTSATRGAGAQRRRRRDAMSVPGTTGALAPLGILPMNSPSASCTSCAACCSACSLAAQQREQRILCLDRVEVEHEPVLVRGHRRQHELLRRDGLLQVEHQAHHARLVLADAHAGDERVVRAHLAHHVAQGGAQLEVVDVDDEAVRVVGDEVARHAAAGRTRS